MWYESTLFLIIIIGLVYSTRKNILLPIFSLLVAFIVILSYQTYENNQYIISSKEEASLLLENPDVLLVSSVEGFGQSAPYTRPGSNRGNPTSRVFGAASGSNGGGDSGNGGSCEPNKIPTYPKVESVEDINVRLQAVKKKSRELKEELETESETKSEKKNRELKESIVEEKKLNDDRRKRGLPPVTLIIKDGQRLATTDTQIRDKFYHFPKVFGSKTPPSLPEETLKKLEDLDGLSYKDRRTVLHSDIILPEKYVKDAAADLREACLDPDTIVRPGTFGKNMESRGVGKSIDGYILYNNNTNQAIFFDSKGFRTAIKPSTKQKTDIQKNNNML